MLDRLKMKALRLLPKNTVSRAFGVVSDIPLPPGMRSVVNHGFAAYAGVNLDEAEQPPGAYPTLNAFFTRKLSDDVHDLGEPSTSELVCPCDGRLVTYGEMHSDTLVQAKGREYSLVDLVDSGREASRFSGGHYATIYLSPRDYHRVHSPASGDVDRISYIPGHLFPVNPFAVNRVDKLFAVNERLITYLESPELGSVAVVMVGATCVGRMSLAFSDVRTNQKFRRRQDFEWDVETHLDHGDELGVFNLGSTVILLIAEPDFRFDEELQPDQAIRLGRPLGAVK